MKSGQDVMIKPRQQSLLDLIKAKLMLFLSSIVLGWGANVGAKPQFVDITLQAGVDFKHVDGRSGQKFLLETLGCGVSLLDFNGDGYLDIYCVNADLLPGCEREKPIYNALYRNNGDMTFTELARHAGVLGHGYGVGCCIGDYDNDGDADIYISCFGPNQLYRNNGDGTFSDVTQQAGVGDPRWGTSCSFADYNNDGYLDLYVANYVEFQLADNPKCAKGDFLTYCNPEIFPTSSGVLYRHNGDGTFTDVSQSSGVEKAGKGLGAVWGDYDNDADLDLFVANDLMQDFLFRNEGNGMFTELSILTGVAFNEDGLALNGMGTSFGDYDNDGNLDLIVTNFQDQPNLLFHNDGDGIFSDVTFASGMGEKSLAHLAWGVDFLDYDNDADLDIFVVNGHIDDNIEDFSEIGTYEQSNQLFENKGRNIFEDVSHQSGAGLQLLKVSRGMAHGDLDNDGDLDLVITNLNQRLDILRNDGGNQNRWLAIKCIGRKSNRDAIGTRIRVRTAETIQIREIRSGGSYLCQSDLRAYFGLGAAQMAEIDIQWPSGLRQSFHKVESNQLLVVEEEN